VQQKEKRKRKMISKEAHVAQIAQLFTAVDRGSDGSDRVSLVYNTLTSRNPTSKPLLPTQSPSLSQALTKNPRVPKSNPLPPSRWRRPPPTSRRSPPRCLPCPRSRTPPASTSTPTRQACPTSPPVDAPLPSGERERPLRLVRILAPSGKETLARPRSSVSRSIPLMRGCFRCRDPANPRQNTTEGCPPIRPQISSAALWGKRCV
jgi:hypothetical protein